MKGELIERKDFAPRFKLSLAEKDQRLAQDAASAVGAKLSINEAVRRLLAASVESGRGEKDVCAVSELCFARTAKPA
jgi:3-hydroxyisobutyrate dehydrogenase-like beta-hydroxyacid dehydrogenase